MPSEIPDINWLDLMPQLVIVSTLLIVLVFDMIDALSKKILGWMTIVGAGIALVVSIQMLQDGTNTTQFNEMFRIDSYSLFFNIIFLVSTILVALISISYLGSGDKKQGPYYLLILLATLGMMLMAAGNELIIIFLGLELMSLSLYVLAGYFRESPASSEAGMKYLLLGAFASAFFLYGIALIYGATGTTSIPGIVEKLTTIAAFISAGPKAAGFAAFLTIFIDALPKLPPQATGVVVLLAMLTMTIGNIIAIAQTNIKRMLAYSSIAHAGYVLIGLAAASDDGQSSAMLYLFIYCVMNIGAFGAVILARTADGENLMISDYASLGFRKPLLGIFMTLMLLSLAGFPPTAGFVGKLYIFKSAIGAELYWLVIVGAINTAISAFYYLRVVVTMYMREPEEELEFKPYPSTLVIGLVLAAVGILLIGILPSLLLNPAQNAVL